MKVLVTGGAGYIGSFTCRELEAQGFDIEVLDNFSTGHAEALAPGYRVHRCDLLDRESVRSIISEGRYDGIVHFAAKSLVGESVANPSLYYRNNTCGSLNLFEAAKDYSVQNIIFSSTAAVYGEPQSTLNEDHRTLPINPYGRSKLAVENILMDMCAAHGMRCIPLRYFNAAGAAADGSLGEDHNPESHLIPLAIGAALGVRPPLKVFGNDYSTHDGTPIRDYIHVNDLAKAHVLALAALVNQHDGYFRPMNVGTGSGSTVFEVISAVTAATGKEVPWTLSERRAGDPVSLVADSTRLQKELGWKPTASQLANIAETAVAWHSRHPQGYRR